MLQKFFESRQKPYPPFDILEPLFKTYAFQRWLFDIDEQPHAVTIAIGIFQTRTIRYDGVAILQQAVGHNGGSEYVFEREG